MDWLDRYLQRHAHPAARDSELLSSAPTGVFEHCIVIPARGESPRMREGLAALGPNTLCIVVVNGSHADVRQANHELLEALHRRGDGPVFWPIDRIDGHEHGVGGARRVGTDLALSLCRGGVVQSRFIHWLDADCAVDAAYFECERAAEAGDAAIVHPFLHVEANATAQTVEAHRRYELSLRHYVMGLEYAGSPYAHHTIGSTIAVDRKAYASVRGVPLREAGEDFHLLDKLRQQGTVLRARTGTVSIRMRRSERVPFGTGPAIERLLEGGRAAFYDWRCFEGLREARQALLMQSTGRELEVSKPVARGMRSMGLDRLCDRIQAGRPEVRARAVDVHLGGLKSLRLIHQLRDGGWPTTGFEDARGPSDAFDPTRGVDEALERARRAELELPLRARALGDA